MSRLNSEDRRQKTGGRTRPDGHGALRILVGSVALCLGCDSLTPREPQPKRPPEKVHRIMPLSPQEANTPVEVNLPVSETLELGLEQCRATALKYNLDLQARLIDPTIAAERVNEERARYEAVFAAGGSLAKSDTPRVSYLDEITGSQADNLNMDVGLQKPLATGGTVSVRAMDNRTKANATGLDFNPYYGSDLAFSISQPLLRNLGTGPAMYGLRIAALDRQITDVRTRLEIVRLIADVDRSYWRLYAARKDLDVRKTQLALAEAQLDKARRMVAQGQVASVEIIRAEAGVAARVEAIIVADKAVGDRQREIRRMVYGSGQDLQRPTQVIPTTEPRCARHTLHAGTLTRAAVENRTEMLELELQLAQDTARIDYARNQALPLISLDYTYNLNGMGESRADSWALLNDGRFADHRVGLRLQLPLGNEAAKSRVRQAAYQKCQRLATQASRKTQIEIEVLNAMAQVEANWQRIMATRQNTLLTGRLYEAEHRQFEQGLRTSTDVLDAQAKLADAQTAEIRALTEYQIALVDLAYATGTLLGASNVQWEAIRPAVGTR